MQLDRTILVPYAKSKHNLRLARLQPEVHRECAGTRQGQHLWEAVTDTLPPAGNHVLSRSPNVKQQTGSFQESKQVCETALLIHITSQMRGLGQPRNDSSASTAQQAPFANPCRDDLGRIQIEDKLGHKDKHNHNSQPAFAFL